MCLDYQCKFKHTNVGFKVFRVVKPRKLYATLLMDDEEYQINQWNKADGFVAIKPNYPVESGLLYESGFHIFKTKDGARDLVLRVRYIEDPVIIKRVVFKGVITTGYEGIHAVIVAKWMKILP